MIRIIAGAYKGRQIKTLPGLAVRPILARIRKSLFDILTPRIVDCDFLDLFAGNGVVGIEALSRGARFAAFADISGDSLKMIEQNLQTFGILDKAKIYQCNVVSNISMLNGKFDIIFMGPPYKDAHGNPVALVSPVLKNILKSTLLKENALVIAQHHKKEAINHAGLVGGAGWNLVREKFYGDTVVSFFHTGFQDESKGQP